VGQYGQCNGNTITDCTITGNLGRGIEIYGKEGQCSGNTIRENTVSRNVDRGILLSYADGNRIEGNNVWGPTGEGSPHGILTASTTSNFILKNTCVGNGTNYSLDSDDTYGPIVEAVGELGTADGASHPWANFSR